MQKLLRQDWRFILFTALVFGAPFSKYPSFAAPLFNFPSFRFGVYQIIALLFVSLCLSPIIKTGFTFFTSRNKPAFYALLVFSSLAGLSVLWSLYVARSALLAVSVVLLVAVTLAAWWYVGAQLTKNQKMLTLRILLIGGIVFGIVALAQFTVASLTDNTLGILCLGCTAKLFGFPRVNGFAAEPQFFASSMLPFVFAAIYAILANLRPRLAWLSLAASVIAIGLSFSRGAYLALALSLIMTALIIYYKKFANLRQLGLIAAVVIMSIFASLMLLTASATIRHHNSPNIVYETLDTIGEQLTGGIIDLPERQVGSQPQASTPPDSTVADDQFVSPGLIEESGNERLDAAKLALRAWRYSAFTSLLGVGIGNLGPFVVAHIAASAPSNLTVYIYYVLLLAELGTIGLICFLTIFGSSLVKLLRSYSLPALLIAGCLTAFLIQFLFFGSYINVVYVWLWLGIGLGMAAWPGKPTKKTKTKYNRLTKL